MDFIKHLNPPQKDAVLHGEGPLLILAGAGSGKTRVITHRIANLIHNRSVRPWNILAVTFTNKAAREMAERVQRLLGGGDAPLIATFHAACGRILRRDIHHLGFLSSFAIYDDRDSVDDGGTLLVIFLLTLFASMVNFIHATLSQT
jgi:DNA helicase-2/ATP-dependent DNA helicase PcrA